MKPVLKKNLHWLITEVDNDTIRLILIDQNKTYSAASFKIALAKSLDNIDLHSPEHWQYDFLHSIKFENQISIKFEKKYLPYIKMLMMSIYS